MFVKEYDIGDYEIIHEATVTKYISPTSEYANILSPYTIVRIVDIEESKRDKKIRGQLQSGGWITLKNIKTQVAFARKLGLNVRIIIKMKSYFFFVFFFLLYRGGKKNKNESKFKILFATIFVYYHMRERGLRCTSFLFLDMFEYPLSYVFFGF